MDIISEEHKKVSLNNQSTVIFQGLRVIKTVLDIKGSKRFKKNNGISTIKTEIEDMSLKKFDLNSAKETFRKNTLKTSYGTSFGEPPKAAEDFVILK